MQLTKEKMKQKQNILRMSPKPNNIKVTATNKMREWEKEVIESRLGHQIILKQTEQLTRETKQLHFPCPMLLSGTSEEH